jgi:predicted O-methyltransferase YrrM
MNAENFEKWISWQVLPNLSPGSVVVIDNAQYHGKQVDKVPSIYSVKVDMLVSLREEV